MLVLERVDDRSEGAFVETRGSATRQHRGWLTAGTGCSVSLYLGFRQTAPLTERRCDPLNLLPAIGADDALKRSVEKMLASRTARCPRETEKPIAQDAERSGNCRQRMASAGSSPSRLPSTGVSGDVRELEPLCATPEAFEVVEAACFLCEDMDDEVKVVDKNPLAELVALHMGGAAPILSKPFDDRVDNGLHLSPCLSRTEHEMVGERRRRREIESDHVERLFFECRFAGLANRIG